MKKYTGVLLAVLLIALCSAAFADVTLNSENFPNYNFRTLLADHYDKNLNSKLDDSEMYSLIALYFQDYQAYMPITNLKGIELLNRLSDLHCYNLDITMLDLSKNTMLHTVHTDDCKKLMMLTLGKQDQLESLSCVRNNLNGINVQGCPNLTSFGCDGNSIDTLDITNNTKLKVFSCSKNAITNLMLGSKKHLFQMDCSQNQLKRLDVSSFSALSYLDCSQNRLTSLKLGKTNPYSVKCEGNQLSVLDISRCPRLLKVYKEGTKKSYGTYTEYRLNMDSRECVFSIDDTVTVNTDTPLAPAVNERFIVDGLEYYVSSSSTACFYGVETSKKKVVIPDQVEYDGYPFKVTEITGAAMVKDSIITELSIGKNVKTIGQNAFKGCKKLKKVTGGKGLVKIGNYAFRDCKSLSAITLDKKVTTIGKQAFMNCKNLKSVTIKTTKLKKKGIGKESFKGINKKAVFKCPKKQLANYTKWLNNPGKAPAKATYK